MSASSGICVRLRADLGAFRLDVAFDAPSQGVTALFGPSGCGKTTVLRCVAGLQHLPGGYLSVGGDVWQDGTRTKPPHTRAIGYVFQEASLFPHLCVRDNLLYGQRRAMKADAEPSAEGPPVPGAVGFDDVVALLGLAHLLERATPYLSGGERQRVAIGRALLSRPRLLLMDEPLAALDRASRDEILPYLEALHDSLAIPVLYVSHDLAEVERLADTLVLLRSGTVLASGPLEEIQSDPTLPLARLPEAGVILHTTVTGHDPGYGLTTLAFDGGELLVPGRVGAIATAHRARIVASDVSVTRHPAVESSILNCLPARIVGTDAPSGVQDGVMVHVVLGLGPEGAGARLLARITRRSWDILGLALGDRVYAQVKSIALFYRNCPSGLL